MAVSGSLTGFHTRRQCRHLHRCCKTTSMHGGWSPSRRSRKGKRVKSNWMTFTMNGSWRPLKRSTYRLPGRSDGSEVLAIGLGACTSWTPGRRGRLGRTPGSCLTVGTSEWMPAVARSTSSTIRHGRPPTWILEVVQSAGTCACPKRAGYTLPTPRPCAPPLLIPGDCPTTLTLPWTTTGGCTSRTMRTSRPPGTTRDQVSRR
mmetsp:Transcript_52148/g.121692  ORF Transcript_52148/g.121692 Transcript_52148/m.121692 type:complete len:203 (-) Transcript_52148:211-819(-)